MISSVYTSNDIHSKIKRLEELKGLLDSNAITKEQFEDMKKAIIE
ncbi:MAG TPA: hypothetical protein DDY68_02565 [Porphyromonadaceae bacterium]|nr:hypothetical protein [Porphyromonadaceae bacterium]